LFDDGTALAVAIEQVAQLGAQLPASTETAREGMRNGYCPVTVKTTAGPVTVQWPKLRGTTEKFASALSGTQVTRPTPCR
jgi:hypothetical protein